jgi:hypothetical protein
MGSPRFLQSLIYLPALFTKTRKPTAAYLRSGAPDSKTVPTRLELLYQAPPSTQTICHQRPSERAPLPSRGLILYHSVTSALVSLVKVSAKITGIENNSSAKRDTRFRRKQRPLTARRVRMPMPALRVTTTFCRPVERANACRNRFNRNTRGNSSDSTRTLARLQDTERTMPRAN